MEAPFSGRAREASSLARSARLLQSADVIRFINLIANLFPVWVLAGCLAALRKPTLFEWFGPYIVPGLGVIMLGMGITLSASDFARVFRLPRPIALGFIAQFSIMPLLGWTIAALSGLPTELAVGIILVSCCPGGTASNVVTYIARANLALSLLMTMCSTFGAIVLTPLLTSWLVGQRLPVDAWGLFSSTFKSSCCRFSPGSPCTMACRGLWNE